MTCHSETDPQVRELVASSRRLADSLRGLEFPPPVDCIYQPLDYAWESHRCYLERFGKGPKRVVFLGMNPGPFGMAQTGVPFGEVSAVRDWMGIHEPVGKPPRAPETPGRRIPMRAFRSERTPTVGLVRATFCLAGEVFQGPPRPQLLPVGVDERDRRQFNTRQAAHGCHDPGGRRVPPPSHGGDCHT